MSNLLNNLRGSPERRPDVEQGIRNDVSAEQESLLEGSNGQEEDKRSDRSRSEAKDEQEINRYVSLLINCLTNTHDTAKGDSTPDIVLDAKEPEVLEGFTKVLNEYPTKEENEISGGAFLLSVLKDGLQDLNYKVLTGRAWYEPGELITKKFGRNKTDEEDGDCLRGIKELIDILKGGSDEKSSKQKPIVWMYWYSVFVNNLRKEYERSDGLDLFLCLLHHGLKVKDLANMNTLYSMDRLDYGFINFSLVLFVADVFSDFILGIQYFFGTFKDCIFGALTLFFVIVPSLLINIHLDNDVGLWRQLNTTKYYRYWIGPYLLFNAEPVVLYIRNILRIRRFLKYVRNSKMQKQMECWYEFIYEYRQAIGKRDWEAVLEAGPQMMIQMYIIFENNDFTLYWQEVTLFLSIAGITATLFTRHKAVCLENGQRISKIGCFLHATGRSIPIGCRAAAIAALMSARPAWCLGFLAGHWALCAGWVWRTGGTWGDLGRNRLWASGVDALGWTLRSSTRSLAETAVCNALWGAEDLALLGLAAWLGPGGTGAWVLAGAAALDVVFRLVICLYCWALEKRRYWFVIDVR